MMHEIPSSETERTPEVSCFNVDAMSDNQLIVLYRGLATVADAGNQRRDPFDQMQVGDALNEQLQANVREMVHRDPERLKNLVHRCASNSGNDDYDRYDRNLAAYVAPALVAYDYEFTRDTLIALRVQVELQASDTARDSLAVMMLNLSPEQISDINARLDAHDNPPIRPGVIL